MKTTVRTKIIYGLSMFAMLMVNLIDRATAIPPEFEDEFDAILAEAEAAQRRQNLFTFFIVVLILGGIFAIVWYLKKKGETQTAAV